MNLNEIEATPQIKINPQVKLEAVK